MTRRPSQHGRECHSTLALRAATHADAPRLAELARGAYEPYVARLGGPPRPMIDDYLEVVRTHDVTVAEIAGGIVGLVVLAVTEEGLAIDNVAVEPSLQGNGIGRALLEHAELTAKERGFDSLYLYTHELMTENQALYTRAGYVAYDRRLHGDACLVYMRKRIQEGTRG